MYDSLVDSVVRLARQDRRYRPEAYFFVFDALNYAQQVLGLGAPVDAPPKAEGDESEVERHLTGQQLCEAIRLHALDQYGYMAKCVLNSWGVQKTGDFGEIVYNLINNEKMRKTDTDRREDFDDVFDFETGLTGSFHIAPPKESQAG